MPPEPQDNPFASPAAPVKVENAATAVHGGGREGFAHQAVRFSLYAPILMIAVNLFVRSSLGANHPGAIVFAVISVLMIAAGFFLGVAGTIGSFRRFSLWSIFLGLLGALVNGAMLLALLSRWSE